MRVCAAASSWVWEWKKGAGSLAKLQSLCIPNIPPPSIFPLSALPSSPAVWFHSYLAHSSFNPCIQMMCSIWWFVCCLWWFWGSLSSRSPPCLDLSFFIYYYYYCIYCIMHMCQMYAYPATHSKLSIIGLGLSSLERGNREWEMRSS